MTKRGTSTRNRALRMDGIARGPFDPQYPVIARQVVTVSGIRNGTCLDIGSGTAQLANSLGTHSDLDIFDDGTGFGVIRRKKVTVSSVSGRYGLSIRHAGEGGDTTVDLLCIPEKSVRFSTR